MERLFDEKIFIDEKGRLFYAILYRNFKEVVEIIARNNFEFQHVQNFMVEGFSLQEIIKWNIDYLEQFDKHSGLSIQLTKWIEAIENETTNNKFTYDEIVRDGKSIFDIFFKCQPLLGINKVKDQDLPSKQVRENNASLVLDEVGSGKSVAAMYSMADIIDAKKDQGARILIVAPSTLKEKWHHDIRRQLGRYSHIVSRGDSDGQYEGDLKSVYFKEKEHCLFIIDNIDIEKKKNMQKWREGKYSSEFWDLAIVDECHLCTDHYEDIRAKNIMLLTATPIVVSSKKTKVDLNNYRSRMRKITGKPLHLEINPIQNRTPKKTDIFVNRFREDFDQLSCNRIIKFYDCIRNERWHTYYEVIAKEKGTLVGLHYAQDDDYLIAKYNELQNKVIYNKYNGKIIMLKYILGLHLTEEEEKYIPNYDKSKKINRKSYIVFCEHTEVIDTIYDSLKQSHFNLVVAKKYADTEIFDEGKCEAGTLISQLNERIKNGQQTILLTTGQSGGTGLNLGHFDGVVHYELPFTSIQLEQRYGRVDRMDVQTFKEKEMIFLLNACDKKDYFNHNAMLYYCVSKIDKTCKYLPIRNTVLFYPEVIQQVVQSIEETLQSFMERPLFQSPTIMKDLNDSLKMCKADISESLEESVSEEKLQKLVNDKENIQDNALKDKMNVYEQLTESKKSNISTLVEYEKIKSIAQNIMKITADHLDERLADDLFITQDVTNIENEQENDATFVPEGAEIHDEILEGNEKEREKNWLEDLTELMENLQQVNTHSINGDGIFYMKDNQLMKASVADFRELELLYQQP